MESLMLTSSFVIDKTNKITVGLSDLTTAVIVFRKPRGAPFYITSHDWELFTDRLQQADRKQDTTFFQGTYMSASSTPQQHLILSYYVNWLDQLLHVEPYHIALSAKATTNLINLIPTINSVLDKMKDFTAVSGGNGLVNNPASPPPQPRLLYDLGFYEERSQ